MPQPLDRLKREETRNAMIANQGGVTALSDSRTNYRRIHSAVEAGLHIVDVLKEYHRGAQPHERASRVDPKWVKLNERSDWIHDVATKNPLPRLTSWFW